MDKINAFLAWWHSIFGAWSPNKLPSLAFWFLEDELMQYIPMMASWALLAVVICSILSIPLSFTQHKSGAILFKIGTVPLCFVGLLLLGFANEMSYELFHEGIRTFKEIYGVLIPGLFSQPDVGSFILELLSVIIAIPLNLFQILLYTTLTLLGLAPFLILIVADIFLYTWAAPIHILADIGGGILLILALALIVLGAGFIGAFMLLVVFLPGFGPIFFQGIREWNFIGSGGTIIKK